MKTAIQPLDSKVVSPVRATANGIGGRKTRPCRTGTHIAAQRVRVLVVHLSLQRIAAGRGNLGGRDAVRERVGRTEERVRHAQRLEDLVVEEDVERLTGHGLDHEPKDIGAEVGIDVALTGLALEVGR